VCLCVCVCVCVCNIRDDLICDRIQVAGPYECQASMPGFYTTFYDNCDVKSGQALEKDMVILSLSLSLSHTHSLYLSISLSHTHTLSLSISLSVSLSLTHTFMYVHTCMHTITHTHTQLYTHAYIHACTQWTRQRKRGRHFCKRRTRTHTHVLTQHTYVWHTHTHIHTCIHTHRRDTCIHTMQKWAFTFPNAGAAPLYPTLTCVMCISVCFFFLAGLVPVLKSRPREVHLDMGKTARRYGSLSPCSRWHKQGP